MGCRESRTISPRQAGVTWPIDFELISILQITPAGVLYSVQDIISGAFVTLKHRTQWDSDKLVTEVKIHSRLAKCTGVVQLLYAQIHAGIIVTRDTDGNLAASGRLSESRVIEIVGSLARTLREIHDTGIVHGNLTLENVLIKGSRVFISNFSCSFWIGNEVSGLRDCDPESAPPEAHAGDTLLGPAMDVWALGLIGVSLLGTPTKKPEVLLAMLNPDPKTRISLSQVLAHPWLSTSPCSSTSRSLF